MNFGRIHEFARHFTYLLIFATNNNTNNMDSLTQYNTTQYNTVRYDYDTRQAKPSQGNTIQYNTIGRDTRTVKTN